MKLLNRNNLAVRFAASKDESRYTLKAILATENETVATDGHMLARVSLPDVKAESFPSIDGFKPNGFTRALIPLDAAKDIENAIPKKTSIPILAHAAISVEQTEERQIVKVAATDLDTPKIFTVRQADGQFPNWEIVFGDRDRKPVIDVCFDAKLLTAIAQAAVKFSDNDRNAPIRLRFFSNSDAARFDLVNSDGQEMNGLVMPLRATVEPKFRAAKPEPEPEPEPEPDPEPEAEPIEPVPQGADSTWRNDFGAQEKTLQQLAGAGELAIGAGWGFYDVTHYPHGGDFRRAVFNIAITEIIRDVENVRREVEVLLHTGHKAIVEKRALVYRNSGMEVEPEMERDRR